jgi:hypothetical protein
MGGDRGKRRGGRGFRAWRVVGRTAKRRTEIFDSGGRMSLGRSRKLLILCGDPSDTTQSKRHAGTGQPTRVAKVRESRVVVRFSKIHNPSDRH